MINQSLERIDKRNTIKGVITKKIALRFLAQICLALDVMHEEGFIHRDVKPENILIMGGAQG